MRVLILHGWGGSDYPHWQARLAGKLACNYKRVCFPLFSDFMSPKKDVWLKELKEIVDEFKPTIVVCHSLGNILWLWYAFKHNIEIEKLYMVAVPSDSVLIKENALKSFCPAPMAKSLGAKKTFVVASTNDPFCNIDEAKEFANRYSADFKVLEDAGHINSDSGFGKWDWMEQQFNFEWSCE